MGGKARDESRASNVATSPEVGNMDREQQAIEAIERFEIEGKRYAEYVADEMSLEVRRPLEKQQATLRIMEGTNPLTNKAHSASSAEAVVESDSDYLEFRAHQSRTVINKQMAWACLTAARGAGEGETHE